MFVEMNKRPEVMSLYINYKKPYNILDYEEGVKRISSHLVL